MTSKAKLILIAAIAAVSLASPALALTQQVSHLICPSGYSVIGGFCINDKTGDNYFRSEDLPFNYCDGAEGCGIGGGGDY
jgi:hypothetical protein